MLREYAVDPAVAATWIDRRTGRYFIGSFGIGTSRILSNYPRKRWKKLVWQAWETDSARRDGDRKRMEVLIPRLLRDTAHRPNAVWDPDSSWLQNAMAEHERAPFHAVLARRNPARHACVLVADDVNDDTELWADPPGTTARTADDMARAVGSMLRMAERIVFVDPHFAPHRRRFRSVLEACLRECFHQRIAEPPEITILSAARDGNGTPEGFRNQCLSRLPRLLPMGWAATVTRLQELPGGEKLHNRYVLTEHGGVSFGVGLDRGDGTDDLHLLRRDQYEKRWSQYTRGSPAFDWSETPIRIDGVGAAKA